MARLYQYVGPSDIANRSRQAPPGTTIASSSDILRWIKQSGAEVDRAGNITATFVIDATGKLRLADRHSEHVACAESKPVRAAGEMTFCVQTNLVVVAEVTNQSTGYCPEPESWSAVALALRDIGISGPEGYATELLFRRCPHCGQINVIKNFFFECAVCDAALPEEWNFNVEIDD